MRSFIVVLFLAALIGLGLYLSRTPPSEQVTASAPAPDSPLAAAEHLEAADRQAQAADERPAPQAETRAEPEAPAPGDAEASSEAASTAATSAPVATGGANLDAAQAPSVVQSGSQVTTAARGETSSAVHEDSAPATTTEETPPAPAEEAPAVAATEAPQPESAEPPVAEAAETPARAPAETAQGDATDQDASPRGSETSIPAEQPVTAVDETPPTDDRAGTAEDRPSRALAEQSVATPADAQTTAEADTETQAGAASEATAGEPATLGPIEETAVEIAEEKSEAVAAARDPGAAESETGEAAETEGQATLPRAKSEAATGNATGAASAGQMTEAVETENAATAVTDESARIGREAPPVEAADDQLSKARETEGQTATATVEPETSVAAKTSPGSVEDEATETQDQAAVLSKQATTAASEAPTPGPVEDEAAGVTEATEQAAAASETAATAERDLGPTESAETPPALPVAEETARSSRTGEQSAATATESERSSTPEAATGDEASQPAEALGETGETAAAKSSTAAVGSAQSSSAERAAEPGPVVAALDRGQDRDAAQEAQGDRAAPGPTPPSFDIVRVEPDGSAVIAGRAPPESRVILSDNDGRVGEAEADFDGNWVLIPKRPLKSGNRILRLVAVTPDGLLSESGEGLLVYVPSRQVATGGDTKDSTDRPQSPLVVLTPNADESDAATRALQVPGREATAPDALRILSVDYDREGKIRVAGQAPAEAAIQIYLDDRFFGRLRADQTGQWLFAPESTIPPGLHSLRADALDAAGQVVARVETPFSRVAPQSVPADQDFVVVQPGNSLWVIARRTYGRGILYHAIYAANRDQIRDPDLIYPGQVFLLPETAQ
ncbi:MAG: hypothetical protein Kilf2KO_02140 [Rhodospirillales bacterium]